MRPWKKTRIASLPAALTTLLLLPALDACGGDSRPRQVVLILLDAARADRISASGYPRPTTPALDGLAARGAIFLTHYAQATTTRASLPSMLHSRYFIPPLFPASSRVPYSSPEDLFKIPDSRSLSLPRALAAAGFHTALISAHTWLREETPFAAEFDETHDLASRLGSEPGEGYPRAGAVVQHALRWIEEHRDEDFFLWLHLMDTHFPHHPGPEARAFLDPALRREPLPERFTAAGGIRDTSRPLTSGERLWLDALYDGSLRSADAEIGRLLERLRRPDGERVIVVTSDHGEALMEQPGRFGHGIRPYETVARVPLILWRTPGHSPLRIDAPTEAIDVAPTLLGLLGVALPDGKSFDGRDLSDALEGRELPGRPAVIQGAIRTAGWKCIFDQDRETLLAGEMPSLDRLSGELYDLEADPGERSNLWAGHPEIIKESIAAYRERLLSSWRRYEDSTTEQPSPTAFAISARHFSLEPDHACTSDGSRLEAFFGSGEEWMRFCDPQGDFLIGDEASSAIRIGISMPDGAYLVRLGIRGTATIDLGEPGQARRLTASPFDPWDYFPWSVESITAGRVVVRERRFTASIRPGRKGQPLLVEYVGFTPEGVAGSGEGEAHLERLRSLGYVD